MTSTIRATLLTSIAAGVLFLAGCTTVGVQVKPEQLTDFKAGVTTEADVIAKLGRPNTSMLNYDGTRTMIYSYIHAQARPASFIPIAGAFVGGTDSQMNTTMLRFDKDGKLLGISSSESNYGSGTGLAAGRPMPQTDQPRQAD